MTTRTLLDTAGASTVAQVALAEARRQGLRVVVAVVDPWGDLLHLDRTEGAQAASAVVATDKARTAAIFRRPSRELEEQVGGGRLGALALPGAAALTGGIPLLVGDQVVGAVGTSGETPDQDESVSRAGAAASYSTVVLPGLSQLAARRVAGVVAAAATGRGVAPVVAVVDAGGSLVYLWRGDEAQVASVDVALAKARTAALYRRPSADFETQAATGRPSALHLARAVPLQGGIPLTVGGTVVGAVGVSGASSAHEDSELAQLGAGALADEPTSLHLGAAAVAEGFSRSGLLLRRSAFAVDAATRRGPGEEELHPGTTDVISVVAGTATVQVADATYDLSPGDLLVVPAGMPHRFTAASDPFRYLVVKVEEAT